MVALSKLPEMVRSTWRDLVWEYEEIPEQGMDHAVMMLRGVSSTEHELEHLLPESLVLRVPHEPEYRAQAPLESALIAQLFRGSSVRVPETVRQAYARGTFNTPHPVMLTLNTEVDGAELTPQLWSTLTPAQRTLAAEQLGSLLASMHSMDPDLLPVSKVESWWTDGPATQQLSTAARTLPAKHQLMKQRLADYLAPHVTDEEYHHIQTVFAQIDMLLARPNQQRCLTHSDLYSEHLLWQSAAGTQRSTYAQGYERSGIGVIDFSDMTVGDPAVDYMHFGAIDPALPRMVLAAAWFYTGGKNPYGYRGLGEVAVVVFFGLVAVLGTEFTQAGRISWTGCAFAVTVGSLSSAVNLANNLRDIPTDTQAGKITLAVRLGEAGTRYLWAFLVAAAALLTLLTAVVLGQWWLIIAALLPLPLFALAARPVLSGARGGELIPVLGLTGRGMLLWALITLAVTLLG